MEVSVCVPCMLRTARVPHIALVCEWKRQAACMRSCKVCAPRGLLTQAKIALVRLYSAFTFELEPGQVPLRLAYGITTSPR